MMKRFPILILLLCSSSLFAQQGPVAVRFTEAINKDLRGSVELTGTVESREASVVASEVEGIVDTLHAREGELVRRGAPIASLRAEDLRLRMRALEGDLQEANARLELAEASLKRARGMFEDQIISQQQLDDALSESQAWMGRVARLDAEMERVRRDLARSTIRAPFMGVIAEERVAVGEWVSSGGAIAELIDITSLEVTVDAPERHFGSIDKGDPVRVILPALENLEVAGRVRAVIPRSSTSSRTFPVKVSIDSNGGIGVGMRAQVHVPVGRSRPVTIVPKDAIVRQGSQEMIYLIGPDETAKPVPVTTGASAGVWLEVRGDVSAGDRVITRGNERLRPGQSVAAQPIEYEKP